MQPNEILNLAGFDGLRHQIVIMAEASDQIGNGGRIHFDVLVGVVLVVLRQWKLKFENVQCRDVTIFNMFPWLIINISALGP